jgi:Spy/CpxP family protein refolding chaperone
MPPPQRGFFKQLIINDLNLNSEQINDFDYYQQDFIRQSHIFFDSIRNYNQIINQELTKEMPDTQIINIYADKIGKTHKNLKINFVNYYMNIKNILSPEQQKKLPEVFDKFRQQHQNGFGQQHRHRWQGQKHWQNPPPQF